MDTEHRFGKLHRLYKVFAAGSHHPSRRCDQLVIRQKDNCFFRRFFGIPVVHASDALESKEETTMDKLSDGRPTVVVSDADILAYLAQETGKDRLRAMFTLTEKNERHCEVDVVVNAATGGGLLMTFVGWLLGSKMAKDRFIEKSMHKKFETKFKGMRAYNDALFIAGAKRGIKLGVKTSIFITLFLMTSQSISFYRNKTSVLEFAAGGVVTGSLFRLNMGLKGVTGGAVVGGALGTVCGILCYGMFHLANDTMEARHNRRVEEIIRLSKQDELMLLPKMKEPSSEKLSISDPLPS